MHCAILLITPNIRPNLPLGDPTFHSSMSFDPIFAMGLQVGPLGPNVNPAFGTLLAMVATARGTHLVLVATALIWSAQL